MPNSGEQLAGKKEQLNKLKGPQQGWIRPTNNWGCEEVQNSRWGLGVGVACWRECWRAAGASLAALVAANSHHITQYNTSINRLQSAHRNDSFRRCPQHKTIQHGYCFSALPFALAAGKSDGVDV
jgi:hypothetical protein